MNSQEKFAEIFPNVHLACQNFQMQMHHLTIILYIFLPYHFDIIISKPIEHFSVAGIKEILPSFKKSSIYIFA